MKYLLFAVFVVLVACEHSEKKGKTSDAEAFVRVRVAETTIGEIEKQWKEDLYAALDKEKRIELFSTDAQVKAVMGEPNAVTQEIVPALSTSGHLAVSTIWTYFIDDVADTKMLRFGFLSLDGVDGKQLIAKKWLDLDSNNEDGNR